MSQHLNIAAAQFELNAYLRTLTPYPNGRGRPFEADRVRVRRAIDAFVALVLTLAAAEKPEF